MPTIPRTYLTTQKSTLGNIQPKNGQVISLWDTDGVYYDVPANGAPDGTPIRRKISSLKVVFTLDGFIPAAGGTGTEVPMEDIVYVYIRPSTDPEKLPETNQPLYDMRVWVGDAVTGSWYIVGTNRDDANVKSTVSSEKFYLAGSTTLDDVVGSIVKSSNIYIENGKINGTITNAEYAINATKSVSADRATSDNATPPKPITRYLYDANSDATTNLGTTITFTLGDGTSKSVRVSDTTYGTYTSANSGLVPPTSTPVTKDTTGLLLAGDGWIDKDDIIVPVSDKAEKDGRDQVIADTYIKGVAYSPITEDLTITYGNNTTGEVHIPNTQYSVFTTSRDGLVPKAGGIGETLKFLRGDAKWASIPSYVGTTAGLVPDAPTGTDSGNKYLRSDGSWNGTFSTNVAGLVPGPSISSASYSLKANGTWTLDIDTKNTTGATNDITNKLYVIGAQSQGSETQTYSNTNVFIQNNRLFSNGKEVIDLSSTQALTNKTYEGMTLGTAAEKQSADQIAPNISKTDVFSGDGATTTFLLSAQAINLTSVLVGGIAPSYTYELDSNNNIVFAIAPSVGTDNIEITYTTANQDYEPNALPTNDAVVNYIPDAVNTALAGTEFITSEVIAHNYNQDTTYAIGDYCTYNNGTGVKLYRCTVGVSTSEHFNPLKWEEITTVDVIGRVLSGTLVAGATSITFNNPAINSSACLDIKTSIWGVNPTNVNKGDGTVTITFSSQASNMVVKLRIL